MNSRIPLLILVVACIALVVALLSTRKKAVDETTRQQANIVTLSNDLQVKSIALAEVTGEKQDLEKQLTEASQQYDSLSNNYVGSTSRLAQTQVTLSETAAALALAEGKIRELEGQNEELDRQAADLNQTLANLTVQIEQTQHQLDMAQGDKALLQAELERLMAEKAELERQLNDLDVLREQISRLKSELAIERRLDWIRRGLLGADTAKGASRQMQNAKESRSTTGSSPKEEPKYDLNVEILDDGTVRVLPAGGETNTPAPATP